MVTATLYYSRNNTGFTTSGTWSGSITINGTTKSDSGYLSITYNSNTKAITNTVKVPHNTDGTKTITISATGSISGTTLSGTSVSSSVTLNTIPRAATLNSLTCSTSYLDGTFTYKYTPTTTSYYIRGNLSLNLNGEYISINSDNNGKPSSAAQQTKTINLDSDQLTTIYKKLPSSTSGTLRLTLRTYSDSGYTKQVGEASYKEVKLTIPSDVKPSIDPNDITLDPANITLNGTSYNYLLKGKNQLSLSVSGVSAGSGSSIKSYEFSGPSMSKTDTSASTSVATVTNVASFTDEKATLTYKVTITDKRNRSSYATKTIVCYDYKNPYFSSFKVSRSNTTLKCTYTPVFSSINGKNTASVKIYYTTGSTTSTKSVSSVTSGTSISTSITLVNATSTYQVYAVITDGLSEQGCTATKTMYGEARVMNVRADGTGIAFGKMAETSNLFECKWPVKINDRISFGTGTQSRLYTDSNSDHTNIIYLMLGTNTSAGVESGLALHESSFYVPGENNDGIIALGSGGRKWNQLYATNGTISTSDRNKKEDIAEMSDTQEQLFNELKPVTYKLKSGASGRTHYGFISQDIEESMNELGLSGTDFAGFCKDKHTDDDGNCVFDENGDEVYDYSLRYSEFIALNTHMIQKLQQEIEALKAEINTIKNKQQ
jgi:hypothetical protein